MLLTCLGVSTYGQHLSKISEFPLDGYVMDVWGATDEYQREYALIGRSDTTSQILTIIEVTDSQNPKFLSEIRSPSFDIKVFKHYAYGVTGSEQHKGQVVDFSDPEHPFAAGQFPSGHNLFIDDRGFMYVAREGIKIYDLNLNPAKPQLIWSGLTGGHDILVKDDLMYDFHDEQGTLIWDVSDPYKPVQLSVIDDPEITYHHSGWITQDRQFIFICDELARGSSADITVWDITDIEDPIRVGEYNDTSSTAHNFFVLGNYAYTSYYASGTVVFDISDPANLWPVAGFDPNQQANENLTGNFGVYPFLPSGTILSSESDIGLVLYSFNDTLQALPIFESENKALIFPNPVEQGNVASIETNGYHWLYEIALLGPSGKFIQWIDPSENEGQDFIEISTHNLSPGVYSVVFYAIDSGGQRVIAQSHSIVVK